MESYALISDDGRYRYYLGRRWGDVGSALATFVMLNPSTADAEKDDRTIVRCRNFAKALGCGGLHVVNLYAFRATKPANLWLTEDPVGPENDRWLREAALFAQLMDEPLIAAWGANARPERVAEVRNLRGMDRLTCLGTTKDGAPRHPLYLPQTARPVRWAM